MKKEDFSKMFKSIPLDVRLKVAIETHFLVEGGGSLLMPLDENGNDIPEVVAKNQECLLKAKPILGIIQKELEGWERDGRP